MPYWTPTSSQCNVKWSWTSFSDQVCNYRHALLLRHHDHSGSWCLYVPLASNKHFCQKVIKNPDVTKNNLHQSIKHFDDDDVEIHDDKDAATVMSLLDHDHVMKVPEGSEQFKSVLTGIRRLLLCQDLVIMTLWCQPLVIITPSMTHYTWQSVLMILIQSIFTVYIFQHQSFYSPSPTPMQLLSIDYLE